MKNKALKGYDYMERTGDILYAMIKDDNFLALKVDAYNHWSDKELLNIAHDNWSELTSDWDVDATPVVDYTSDEIGKIRKMGVNVIVARTDGSATLGGFGITTAGTSIEHSVILMDLNRMFENAYNEVKDAVGDVNLELAFDEYSNICIVDPISMRDKAVCNIPDISQCVYLLKCTLFKS